MKNYCETSEERMRSSKQAKLLRKRGFTLIELMIIVVIVGVLASLAIYGVQKYVQHAKTSESAGLVAQIMWAQEGARSTAGQYLNVTGGVTADEDYYPVGTFDGNTMIQWGGASGCMGVGLDGTAVSCLQGFNALGIGSDTAVRFRYAVTTFALGEAPPVPTSYVTGFNPGNVTSDKNGYVVVALSDLDGDPATRSAVVGSSLRVNLYMENLGK